MLYEERCVFFRGQRLLWRHSLASCPRRGKALLAEPAACLCQSTVVAWLFNAQGAVIPPSPSYSLCCPNELDGPCRLSPGQRYFCQPFQARSNDPLEPWDEKFPFRPLHTVRVQLACLCQITLPQGQVPQTPEHPFLVLCTLCLTGHRLRLLQQRMCPRLLSKHRRFKGTHRQRFDHYIGGLQRLHERQALPGQAVRFCDRPQAELGHREIMQAGSTAPHASGNPIQGQAFIQHLVCPVILPIGKE